MKEKEKEPLPDKVAKEIPEVKRMSDAEYLEMKIVLEKKLKELSLTVVAYARIMPSLGISRMNPVDLCSYVADKLPRIALIPGFTLSTPLTTDMETLLGTLTVLAGKQTNTMLTSEKVARKSQTKQLRGMMMDKAASCALLSAGNLELFLLTGIGVRKAAEGHNAQLEACVAKWNHKKGGGKLGIGCTPLPYATNYTVYTGKLPFNKNTWSFQIGGANQVIDDLTKGDEISAIMVGNAKGVEGKMMDPITTHVPFN